jgi:E3 ubiquitin-protein ligase MYCBP2
LAYLAPIATSDSKNATQILSMIRHLLPLVVYLNKSNDLMIPNRSLSPLPQSNSAITTSRHYVTVESDHPYKAATVSNYRVKFPPTVKWMCVEFDSRCATAQPEDTLQIYVPEAPQPKCWESTKNGKNNEQNNTLWPILKKFQGKSNSWPTSSIIIPGNELIFSLETASDYVKEEKASYYGFRCQVIGYENPITEGLYLGLQYLEQELTYLAGICIGTLLKRNLILPQIANDVEVNYELALRTFEMHSTLLCKGLSLSHPLTAAEALDGIVPLANEHPFLKDFCALTPGTSGARLAKWFQCESFVDPNQCEVHCSCGADQELQCGWPTVITVITRDQYANMVNVPNLKVEVSAQPFHANSNTQSNNECSFGGMSVPPPTQNVQYSITAKDKMFYHAITMMRDFENYSFEELRFVSPVKRRTMETMLVRSNNDGTYTANWTPGSTGWYQLKITVDGVAVNASQSVQVGEPPKGMALPQVPSLSSKSNKKSLPSRTRKFVGRNSSGLRIRSLPSLQSEQVGVIEVNGVITIVEESHNDDGVWVRLSPDSIRKYCNTSTTQQNMEAWALQYNQHLGKTLLVPIGEPKPIVMTNGPTSSSINGTKIGETVSVRRKKSKEFNKRLDFPGFFHVVKCGVSGHNIRSKPHLRAPPVGMLVLGNVVGIIADTVNSSGTWLRLDEESMKRYCFNTEGEAWTLSRTINDVIYLQHEAEVMHFTDEEDNENKLFQYSNHKSFSRHNGLPAIPFSVSHDEKSSPSTNSNACGSSHSIFIDKSLSPNKDILSITSISQSLASESEVESLTNDSIIASPSLLGNTFAEFEKTDIDSYCESMSNSMSSITTTGSRVAALQKKFLHETEPKASFSPKKSLSGSPAREPPPELHGISVRELVKAIGRDQSPTPPSTPPSKRTPVTSRSSSPNVSIGSSRRNTQTITTPIPIKPNVHSLSLSESNCNNLPNDMMSSSEKDRDQSDSIDVPRKCCVQKATQTSPTGEEIIVPSHFLQFKIGNEFQASHSRSPQSSPTASPKLLRSSKEHTRNSRQSRPKRERTHSPSRSNNSATFQPNSSNTRSNAVPVKEAISNSVAECIRAVFASFIWHEGILHDTLAAASYLKFNPEVTKETVKSIEHDFHDENVKIRTPKKLDSKGPTKEQKAKFRHSVEVSQLSALQQECYLNANIEPNKIISESDLSQPEFSNLSEVINEPLMTQSEESANDSLMIPETLVNLLKLWEVVSKCCTKAIVEPPASVMTPANLTAPSTPVQMFNRIQNNPRVIQTNSEELFTVKTRNKLKQMNDLPSNLPPKGYKSVNRYVGQFPQHGNLFGEAALANGGPLYEARESAHSSLCELCGNSYPYPVTHHMRKTHPGCGEHAGGKGYNSSGSFCGGWAGHCGDGGIGSSNWYLICDKCRDKYLSQKRHNNKGQNSSKSKHSTNELKSLPLNSPINASLSSSVTQLEVHQLMKDNAMFLLRMAPANDISGIANSFNSNRIRQSQEFVVQSSSFQCLENLGIHHSTYHQRLAEEHLSEDDIIAIQNGRPSHLLANEQIKGIDLFEKLNTNVEHQKPSTSRTNFQRSVSVGLHDWQQERVVLTQRKRATSNENSSTTFLCQPSATLINLVQACNADNHFDSQPTTSQTENSHQIMTNLFNRPIMQFILHQHDLFGLMIAMKNALRKSSCRTLALHALNWLLRNVSQPVALHDLMWCFVASLTPNESRLREKDENEENAANNGAISANAINAVNAANNAANFIGSSIERRDDSELHYQSQTGICQHPLADLTIAGEAAQPLTHAFHTFLNTVSDLMPLLPMGSPLQQIAVRCFCIHFDSDDHSFLHQCHVFSNISKIFARTEEETNSAFSDEAQQLHIMHPVIEAFQDITAQMEIKASSRQAMIASLTDNSTETFWESGDEDRNKTKIISITNNAGKELIAKSIYIHIDNVRDLGSKISHVTFKYGDSGASETQTAKLKLTEIENRFAGWAHCVLPSSEASLKCIKLELKGPDNTLRLRQIKVLGVSSAKSQDNAKPVINSIQIQQANCEAETLRVFRLLTSQVIKSVLLIFNQLCLKLKNSSLVINIFIL